MRCGRVGGVADWTPADCNQALNQLWEMLKNALWFNELKAPALVHYLTEQDFYWRQTRLAGTHDLYRTMVRDWSADPDGLLTDKKKVFPAIPRWKEDMTENPSLLDWSMHWSATCGATGETFSWDEAREDLSDEERAAHEASSGRPRDKKRRRVHAAIISVCQWDEARYDKMRTGM